MAAIVEEFLGLVEKLDTYSARFEKVTEKSAFWQGVTLGILFNQIEIDVIDKAVKEANTDGKM